MEIKNQGNGTVKGHPRKLPYQSPKLLTYGSVREITRNVGPNGAKDGGGGAAAGPKTG